mmetsp:Transcript_11980/g.32893  ORF Transcript_11980/g.32893 Transcript_11980/m.32893 type:complete len:87 (+) Transcript_11980:1546-1806(+)
MARPRAHCSGDRCRTEGGAHKLQLRQVGTLGVRPRPAQSGGQSMDVGRPVLLSNRTWNFRDLEREEDELSHVAMVLVGMAQFLEGK